MFPFEHFEIYIKAKKLHCFILDVLKSHKELPDFYKNQLLRASLSIIANVAEGAGRTSSKDKRNFYVIARGSLFETVAIVDTLFTLDKVNAEEKNKAYVIC